MAVIQQKPGSRLSPRSEGDTPAPADGLPRFTSLVPFHVPDLIGLSIVQLEWALVLVRGVWIVLAVGMATLSSDMESVGAVWLIAGPIVVVYGAVAAVVLRTGAVRESALLGIALDAALVTCVLPAVIYLASRNDPENIFAVAQLAIVVTTLVAVLSVLRLRLLPAIVVGVFLTTVPAGVAALVADGGVSDGDLGRGALRIATGALLFGTLGQVLQRTRLSMVREIAETLRRRDEAELRAEERDVLAEIGRIVSQSPDVRETYERFASIVRTVLPADRVAVNIYDPERGVLITTYISGKKIPGWEEHASHSLAETPLGSVIREHRGVLIKPGEHELTLVASYVAGAHVGLISAIAVPLQHQGEVVGTLSLRSQDPDAYDGASLRLLERIGTQIAPAVVNAGLFSTLERDAAERAVFAEISRILSASPDIADVYEEFVAQVGKLIRWDRISINAVEPRTERLKTAYASGTRILDNLTRAPRAPGPHSVLEHVARTGTSLLFDDIKAIYDRFPDSDVAVEAGLHSGIYVPLISNGVVIGTIAAGAGEPNAYSDADLKLLERLAGQIAGTIANAELRARTDRQAREEAALAEIGRVITSSLRIEDVYDRFAAQVRALMPADRVSVIEISPAIAELSIRYVSGLAIPSSSAGTSRKLNRNGLLQFVVRSGRGLAVPDLSERISSFPDVQPIVDSGVRSALYSPLRSQGEIIGLLCVASTEIAAHNEYHLELLGRISAQIAGALANAVLHERADRQAREEAALAEIGRIITSSLKIEDVYDRFAANLRALMPAERVSVIEVDPGTGQMSIRYMTEFAPPSSDFGDVHDWRPNALMDTVVRTGEGVAIPDLGARVDDLPDAIQVLESGVRSLLYSPLRSQGEVIGLLCVVSTEADAYSEYHFELLERISAQIAGALANATLHERSDQQAREESALAEIGRIVNSSLDIETVYEQFAGQVQHILPFDRLAIAVLDPDGLRFTVSHVTGEFVPGLEAGTVRAISDTNLQPVLERGETMFQQNGRGQHQGSPIPGASQGLTSSLLVPLISRDRPIGFLALRNKRDNAYTEAHGVLARRVAALASTAISNSVLYERAETEARERAVLAEIGRIVGSSLDIDSIYARFANRVRKLINFDRILIWYVDPRHSSAVYAWSEGEAQTGFSAGGEMPTKPFVGTPLGKIIRSRRGVVLDEPEITEFPGRPSWEGEPNARSMIVVPLVSGDRTIAGLTLSSSEPGAYGIRELEIATRVGSQIAGAVANARLHAALREASEELKDINKQKTEVMTTVAHELKSPLTALRTFMDLVIEGTAGDVPDKQLELLLKASRSTTRMQNLLNVFSHLEMAEDHSIPLTVTMFDLGTLATAAVDLLQPAAAQAKIKVKIAGFDDLPLIEGDRHAIEQVISNLVSNAIKYSYEGGDVVVSCEPRVEDVVISVEDRGIGISSEDQERLFERFYRGTDPTKLHMRGTGLGLYVSRGLVERHHGSVRVQSKAGQGSVFSFTLPFEQPAEDPLRPEPAHHA